MQDHKRGSARGSTSQELVNVWLNFSKESQAGLHDCNNGCANMEMGHQR